MFAIEYAIRIEDRVARTTGSSETWSGIGLIIPVLLPMIYLTISSILWIIINVFCIVLLKQVQYKRKLQLNNESEKYTFDNIYFMYKIDSSLHVYCDFNGIISYYTITCVTICQYQKNIKVNLIAWYYTINKIKNCIYK